jgi:pimeloyl-ACP methyl ester carboxylesterase
MDQTIVMIHGMWGGPWYWENYRRVLEAGGFRCVATRLPYHELDAQGRPDPRLGTASLLDYATALEHEIRDLGEPPILMGHSMGGLLAQMLGARGLARALVLLTPASPAGILALTPSVIRSFWSIMSAWGFWRKPMRQSYAEAAYSMLHLLPEAERKAAYDSFVYESGRAAFEIGFWLIDPRGAAKVDAARVTCPVLVVAGGQDRITPASVVRRVAHKYKAVATYKEFSDHAHWVVGEPGWQSIAEYVLDWLRTLHKADGVTTAGSARAAGPRATKGRQE